VLVEVDLPCVVVVAIEENDATVVDGDDEAETHLILEPHELIEKLAPLIPRPKSNLIVYHGCLASGAQDREQIVAYGRPDQPGEPDLPLSEAELFGDDEEEPERIKRRYYSWSELMLRVFGVDVLECPRCSGRLRFINHVTEPLVITTILSSIGLSPPPPPRSVRHEPMQLLLFPRSMLKFNSPASVPTQPAGCRSPPSGQASDLN
jgi:hypothetical protein